MPAAIAVVVLSANMHIYIALSQSFPNLFKRDLNPIIPFSSACARRFLSTLPVLAFFINGVFLIKQSFVVQLVSAIFAERMISKQSL